MNTARLKDKRLGVIERVYPCSFFRRLWCCCSMKDRHVVGCVVRLEQDCSCSALRTVLRIVTKVCCRFGTRSRTCFSQQLFSSFRLVASLVFLPTCVQGGDSTFVLPIAQRALIEAWLRVLWLERQLRTDTRASMCILTSEGEAWDEFQLHFGKLAQQFLFFVKVRILTICGRGEGCPTALHAVWLEDKLRCVGHVQCVQFTIALSMFCFHMILLVILCLVLFFWFLNVHVFHYFYSLYFCEEQCASPSTRAMLSVVVNCFVMSSCSENCDVYWCFRSRSLRPCSMKVRRFVSRVCACIRFAVVSRCVSCWVLLRECVAVLVRQREHVLENSEFILFVSFRFVASFCRSSKKCSWWNQYVRFTCRKEHWLRREYVWWGRSVNCERTPANECAFATRVFHRERWSMAPHAEIVVAVPRQCVVTWGQRLWTRSRLPNGNKYSTAKGQELCAMLSLDILRVGSFTRRCIHSRLMSFSRYVVLTVRMMVTTTGAPNQHVVSYLRFAFFRTKLLFHFLHSSVLPLRGHRRCRWCSTSLPRVAGELIKRVDWRGRAAVLLKSVASMGVCAWSAVVASRFV